MGIKKSVSFILLQSMLTQIHQIISWNGILNFADLSIVIFHID